MKSLKFEFVRKSNSIRLDWIRKDADDSSADLLLMTMVSCRIISTKKVAGEYVFYIVAA